MLGASKGGLPSRPDTIAGCLQLFEDTAVHVRRDCAGQTHQVVAEVRRDLELKADTAGLRASEKVLRHQIGQLQVGLAACDAVGGGMLETPWQGTCRCWSVCAACGSLLCFG